MNYPEHEKLKKVSKESQTCGAFIEWLEGEGYFIKGERGLPGFRLTGMLAKFFEIDEDKLEDEKRAMLESLRQS